MIGKIKENLFQLFFPHICIACETRKPSAGDFLCLVCKHKLPFTDFHLHAENSVTQRFWGRVPITHGTSLLRFNKSGSVQNMIHALKYNNRQDIGVKLGDLLAERLLSSELYKDLDFIIPVPLHKKKKLKRGYNQAEAFGQGIAEKMQIPMLNDVLIRSANTTTQTKKSRLERFENVETAFLIKKPESLVGKHILIVDDVLTTGATLEACVQELLKIEGVRVSIATIAVAM